MIHDEEKKTTQIKIVYYGPALSGKTTTIKYLFKYYGQEKKLSSIESSVGRTLFFDFGTLPFKGAKWMLKFLMYTATGQDFYAITRPIILRGVDGIIFVADLQKESLEHNIRSWTELTSFFKEELYGIPIVIALNKDDLEDEGKIDEKDFMEHVDIDKFKKLSILRTIAIDGSGVLDSFSQMLKFWYPNANIES